MKSMKKLLALLMALALCLSLVPAAFAAGNEEDAAERLEQFRIAEKPAGPVEKGPAPVQKPEKDPGAFAEVGKEPAIFEEGDIVIVDGVDVLPNDSYGLTIDGTTVTDDNKDDILDDGGTFVYDSESNVLTVNGDYTTSNVVIANQSIDGLVIEIADDVTLKSTSSNAIVARADTTITGEGMLTVVTEGSSGTALLVRNDAELTIVDAYVDATGAWAIAGWDSSESESLVIESSTVLASGGYGAICDFGGGITLTDCEILVPEGGDADGSAVCDSEGNEATYAVISDDPSFEPPVHYGIFIGGLEITGENKDDVLGDGGTFVFNGKDTLTVNGSYSSDTTVIWNKGIDGLVIEIADDVTLESYSYSAIVASYDTIVTGEGRLTANGYQCGLYANSGSQLTIEDAWVFASADYWGICGTSTSGYDSLVVDNSTVIAKADYGAICDFGEGITLIDCDLFWPDGGYIGSYAVLDEDGYDAEEAQISNDPDYEPIIFFDLEVDGVDVTSENMDDVLGDGGTFVFDGKDILTVNGSYTTDGVVIWNKGIDGLVIDVAENATLKSTESVAVTASFDTTVTGEGKLTLRGYSCGLYANNNAALLIQDAYVDASGYWGIRGYSSSYSESLEIENSTVIAAGENGAINNFYGGITLTDCELLQPEDGSVGDSAILDGEDEEATYAVISEDPNFEPPAGYGIFVDGEEVTEDNMDDILGDGGTFVFDGQHTLTVNGNYTADGAVIYNEDFSGLEINIAEDAILESTDGAAIMLSNYTSITGSGRLTLVATEDCGILVKNNAALTIHDVVVHAEGYWGVCGWSTSNEEALAIENATVIARGDSGAICDFGAGITLTDCALITPADGSIGDYAVLDGEGEDTEFAVIAVNPFEDVPQGKYFFLPVLWAFYSDPQVTGGVDATHFGPNQTCTRAQIVTFLWKAAGAPEPTTTVNPFTDVKEGKYYYKAVLWAVENGITSGVSADKFGVSNPCTREQAMMFLWIAAGSPAPSSTDNPFTDVKEGKYYYNAVLWAVENGITSGVSADRFGVGQTCTRAQIMTFLYGAVGRPWDYATR